MRFVVLTDTNSYITKKYFIFFYMRLNVRILKKYKISPHRHKKGTEKKTPITNQQIKETKLKGGLIHLSREM